MSQQRPIQDHPCGALLDGHVVVLMMPCRGMRHCIADDAVSYIARTELVHRMVDMFHHAEQSMEDRCETCIVCMAHQACRQIGLTNIGPIAQRSEQGTHNALVLGSNPSGPMHTILIQ